MPLRLSRPSSASSRRPVTWRERAIRRTDAGRDVPVILMSAAHDLAEEERVGYDLFLAKPFDIDRLLDHVAGLLRSKRPVS